MKYIRKLTPVDPYDIQGLESWLQDMALQGLYLEKFRPLFCTFSQGPARPTRYRIEPHHRQLDDDLPWSMLELYESYGWECVGEISGEMLIFATQDENAPELHTDPQLQGELWRKLVRRMRRSAVFSVLTIALATLFSGWMLFENGTPILTLLTTAAPALLLYLVYSLAGLPGLFAQLRAVTRFTRRLEEGETPPHRAPYPRWKLSGLISLSAACGVLALLIAGQLVLPFTGGGLRRVEDAEGFVPLSLEALEGADYRPYTMSSGDFVDYANFSDRERYLLCTQWEVVQTAQWEEDGRWNRLEILWYHLPAPLSLLSEPLARELLQDAMGLDEDIWWNAGNPAAWDVTYTPREHTKLLALAKRQDGKFQTAAAAAGDKAVLVRYTGHGDLADHLEEIAGMVA